ncbi:MAG: hypothetical protein ABI551_07260 [Polyangiaceae bacterium]
MHARRAFAAVGASGVAFSILTSLACSSKVVGSTFGPVKGDERTYGVSLSDGATAVTDARFDRLSPHDGVILADMHFRAIYIGSPGVDVAPSADALLTWIGTSSYWSSLKQYGVNDATYDGATTLTTDQAFPAGLVTEGTIPFTVFDARVHELVHGTDAAAPIVPQADGYLFFLPDGINIDSGNVAGVDQVTCITSSDFHANDGDDPYIVVPPCLTGRDSYAITHEMSEMATDPVLQKGWFSDLPSDIKSGGEVADVCFEAVRHPSDGYAVAQLWSNADGDCMPK